MRVSVVDGLITVVLLRVMRVSVVDDLIQFLLCCCLSIYLSSCLCVSVSLSCRCLYPIMLPSPLSHYLLDLPSLYFHHHFVIISSLSCNGHIAWILSLCSSHSFASFNVICLLARLNPLGIISSPHLHIVAAVLIVVVISAASRSALY